MEPPGKRSGLDHETVGGHGDSCAIDLDVRGIAQWTLAGTEEKRCEQAFHKPAAGFAAGAMRHLDLRLAKLYFRTKGLP